MLLSVCPVGIQRKVNGSFVPLVLSVVMLPSHFPKQVALVTVINAFALLLLNVVLEKPVQPSESVTVTEKIPGPRFIIVAVVCPLLQR